MHYNISNNHNMKMKALLISILALASTSLYAQRAQEEIRNNVNLAANNYLAYPTPVGKLTPSPKGYEPFYISHYGRHGSRWLIGHKAFDSPYFTLAKADTLGKLTVKGREVLSLVKAMRDNGRSREGELTLLGAQQHRDIARRMYERFPQVFAGKTNVDARSTVVIRCILSMENELLQLAALNPEISFSHDASYHDMYYMNDEHSPYSKKVRSKAAMDSLKAFNSRHSDMTQFMATVFNDAEYAKTVNDKALAEQIFNICIDLQSTELRHSYRPIWDIFSDRELYDLWLQSNTWWYTYFGPNKENDGAGMYTQLNLVENIMQTADSCVMLDHPGATLRFAHEVDVLPLVCLLNINGYGNPRSSLENVDAEGWHSYDIFPMGCNVQFVFYKPTKKQTKADILVKVLLNENEASLPVSTDCAPYYHWKDVRQYMKQILTKKIQ